MTTDQAGHTEPADNMIQATRMVRGILDGEGGPWLLTEADARGMAVLTLSVMFRNAQLEGVEGLDAQITHVRGLLDTSIEQATLLAVEADMAGPGGAGHE